MTTKIYCRKCVPEPYKSARMERTNFWKHGREQEFTCPRCNNQVLIVIDKDILDETLEKTAASVMKAPSEFPTFELFVENFVELCKQKEQSPNAQRK